MRVRVRVRVRARVRPRGVGALEHDAGDGETYQTYYGHTYYGALEHDAGDGGERDLLLEVVGRRPHVAERGRPLGIHRGHVDGSALEARHVVVTLP